MPLEFNAERHEYRWDGVIVPSVTQVLEDVGIIDYRSIPFVIREAAMARGRRVHAATHYDDEGDLDESTIFETDLGFIEAWRRFRSETGFHPELIEHRGFHETYRYSGTLDRTGKLNGATVLLDLKTGSAPWWTEIQTAAYAAFFEGPRRFRRLSVELHGDGSYKLHEYSCGRWTESFNHFVSALNVFNSKQSHQRRAA